MDIGKKGERLSKIARDFNVGIATIVDFLSKKGITVESNPNTKVQPEQFDLIVKEFKSEMVVKKESQKLSMTRIREKKSTITIDDVQQDVQNQNAESDVVLIKDASGTDSAHESATESRTEKKFKILGTIDLNTVNQKIRPTKKTKEPIRSTENQIVTESVTEDPKEHITPEVAQHKSEPVHKSPKSESKVHEHQKVEPIVADQKSLFEIGSLFGKTDTKQKETSKHHVVSEITTENVKQEEPKPSVSTDLPKHSPISELAEVPEISAPTVIETQSEKHKEPVAAEKPKPSPEVTETAVEKTVVETPVVKAPPKKIEIHHNKPAVIVKPVEPEIEIEEIDDVEDDIEEDDGIYEIEQDAGDKDRPEIKVIGKIDLSALNQKTRPAKKSRKQKIEERLNKEKVRKDTFQKENQPAASSSPSTLEVRKVNKPKMEVTLRSNNTSDSQDNRNSEDGVITTRVDRLPGPTVVGRMDLPSKGPDGLLGDKKKKKKKRKRIHKEGEGPSPEVRKPMEGGVAPRGEKPTVVLKADQDKERQKNHTKPVVSKKGKLPEKKEVDDEEVSKQIKETLAKLTASKFKTKAAKYKRIKREEISRRQQDEIDRIELDKKVLRVTEFIPVSELASLMNIQPTKVIAACMSLGYMVSINMRLDADVVTLIAEEFGFEVEFVSADLTETVKPEEDETEDLEWRAPIVTVMGHVDHGKTSLLDYIRKSNLTSLEKGGITQRIGAYTVKLEDHRKITFIDTPGHEAFTAMRARGAKVTDIVIIVIAADDSVMPQTREAINHALAAGVPIVVAINKIDKNGANPEKIKKELADLNILIEEYGGKYQCQEISAKKGINVNMLLDKVILEAEILDLKANPNKRAHGTVLESQLDKGKGYVSTVLVQAGTLKVGDIVLAGHYTGRVKAMYNEVEDRIKEAGPSEPVVVVGLNGAPQAGDNFNVMSSEREAREIASKREQLVREIGLRAQKHITLEEIGRRIAIGNFQELNLIVKADGDGAVEALSDSLIKLSTPQIQVNVIHKGVGGINENDIMLATASNAIIVGYQVRPSISARRLAEKEGIDIRIYSIIYDAIEQIKDAMEGMLTPEKKEEIIGTAEIREVFKITKVGTVAGCLVRDGKINRTAKVRIIRDGIVVYTGDLGSLKRFKDDVREVFSGYECGLNINKYNDLKEGDLIEAFIETEVKSKL